MKRFRRIPIRIAIAACAVGGAVGAGCSQADAGWDDVETPRSTAEATIAAPDRRGPTLTETAGPSGNILVFPDAAFGNFFGDTTILRASDSPACVGNIKAGFFFSPVGEMTVTSDFLLATGSPTATVSLEFDGSSYGFVGGPPFVYPVGQSIHVGVQATGEGALPALPPTDLCSPAVDFLRVLAPVLPPSGDLVIRSNKDLTVVWKLPEEGQRAEGCGEPRVVVDLFFIAGAVLNGEIRCGFPLSARRGVIPASLLHEMRSRISPASPIGGALFRVAVGDQLEARSGTASYVVELGGGQSTNLGQVSATLD